LRVYDLLGHPTDLEGKPKGENSMSGKRINAKLCSMMRRKSCTHGEAVFAEPKFPLVLPKARRSIAATGVTVTTHQCLRCVNTLYSEDGVMNSGKGMNGSLHVLNV
jgi:hypothetical protein